MRRLVLLLSLIVLGSSGASATEGIDDKLVGIWSFDGSCASGDGMSLNDDGTAGFDEWGTGMWYARGLKTIYLILQEREIGLDELKAVKFEEIRLDVVEQSRLKGEMLNDGRKFTAVRCPPAE